MDHGQLREAFVECHHHARLGMGARQDGRSAWVFGRVTGPKRLGPTVIRAYGTSSSMVVCHLPTKA